MRALPAILGSLTVPVVYGIMKESGYSTVIAAFSAALILFGEWHPGLFLRVRTNANANRSSRQRPCCAEPSHPFGCHPHFLHVSDDLLVYPLPQASLQVSLWHVRFGASTGADNRANSEFTPEWWTWLCLTGTFMACAWGSKVNGILTVFAVGAAVLFDLWNVLDHNQEGHTMVGFHFQIQCCC